MMAKHKSDPQGDLRDAFKVFDKNGDGFISAAELKCAMTTLGERLTEQEVSDMIEEADVNGDGQIDYEGICRSKLEP